MIELLQAILCAIKGLVVGFLWALCEGVNLFIEAAGFAIGGLAQLLPDLPPPPGAPDGGVLAVVNYVLPLGGILGSLAAMLACWVAFLVIRIPLRWLRVV